MTWMTLVAWCLGSQDNSEGRREGDDDVYDDEDDDDDDDDDPRYRTPPHCVPRRQQTACVGTAVPLGSAEGLLNMTRRRPQGLYKNIDRSHDRRY